MSGRRSGMAKRRELVRASQAVMPDGLEEIRASSFPSGEVERAEWNVARRARRAARAEFLATVTVRPAGVSEMEFLQAHGFKYLDRGSPKISHLRL